MGRYDDLLYTLIKNNLRSGLEKSVESHIEEQKQSYFGMPDDYIDFVKEIGFGDIGEEYFILYNGLVEPSNIYDVDKARRLRDIVFIGDDYKGCCLGFETYGKWELIEVDSEEKIIFLNTSFEEYMRKKITVLHEFLKV